ncbi:T9SS type A sorting domain-containing protein [Hyphobacterium sp. CCMP332]|nr:T9SS type A sorting domain-containing protein [Hyphobacterium sp. CCMP332]
MKVLINIFLLIAIQFNVLASNPWMDYSMSYFKIKVAKDALYKLDQNDLGTALASAGFNIATIDSSKWAIFYRGQEMAIHYENGDIYFYGKHNDASLDTGLYFEGGLANPYLNMFSDSSAYFLTWYVDARTGKRFAISNVSNPINTDYHFANTHWEPSSYRYNPGENYNSDNSAFLYMGSFQPGEGWSGAYSTSSIQMLIDSITNFSSTGPAPLLDVRLIAEGKLNNSSSISLGNSSPRVWNSNVFKNQAGPVKIDGEILASDIENNSLKIDATINSGAFSPTHAELFYPQNIGMFGLQSKVFVLDSSLGNEISFSIDDLNINSANDVFAIDISDPFNLSFCETSYNSLLSELKVEINNANVIKRKILICQRSSIATISEIDYRDYQNLSNPDQDFIMVYPNQFDSVVQLYYDFRGSSQGGNFKPLKIEIEEVFDQFSFGESSPVGIRELCRYMHNNSSASSNYLFLIGKGLFFNQTVRINNVVYRYRFNPELFTYKNLVPTFGYPGGDWPYVMNFNPQNPNEIAFGVGRIASRTPQQVLDYLNKIKEFEDPVNNGLWRKRMLHLSGGVTELEIQRFYNHVNQFKAIAEGPFLGAEVQTINKTEPAGVQNIFIDTVINRGISLLTMYGHSSAQFNDIEIGDVNDPNLNYNNSDGQYPMFIINGCETGRIYETFESWAQNWINVPAKGASLMLAHSFDGFDPILKFYTEHFYKTAFADSLYFGKPVGDILTESSNNFKDEYSAFYGKFIQSQLELMTLQGDPALRISGGLGQADYAIDQSGIIARSFDGTAITTNTDSFQLLIPLENLGRFSDEFVGILVERQSPVSSIFDTVYIPSFGYSDTVFYTIYNYPDNSSLGGLNEFSIRLDPGNYISESDEVNNIASYSLLLPVQYVRNISPVNFGIVSNSSVRMVSSAQLPEGVSSILYQFELDSSYLFDSPFKKTFQYQSGNTGIWNLELPAQSLSDTSVYFWRSKKLEDTIWSGSSFTYIEGSNSGWSQSVYGQFIDNEYSGGLRLNDSSRELEFLDFSSDLELRFAGQKGNYRDTTLIKIGNALLRKNSNLEARSCAANRMLLVRISGQTGQPYRDLSPWDGRNCGIQPFGVRQFTNVDIRVDSLETSLFNYINETNPDDYIMLMAHGLINFNTLSSALRDTLSSFGIDTLLWDDLERFEPFMYLGRKNWNGSFYIRGDTALSQPIDSQVVDLPYTLTETYRNGRIKSVRIGPAKSWSNIDFDIHKEQNDIYRVDLLGLKNNGYEDLIFSDLTKGVTDLSSIDADAYPYIFLTSYFEDSIDRSPAQLHQWTVIYEGTAEGLIDPLAFGINYYQNISIQEGDTLNLDFSFKNISEFDFTDSLRVTFSINETVNSEKYIDPPKSGDSSIFNYELITSGLIGDLTLRTFVNPYDESELFYDNNILETDFNVFGDEVPPIISATFDGIRIVNNDVVAYNTEIRISLQDENPFLKIKDSSAIFFELYKTENFVDSLLSISDENILIIPQTNTENFQLIIFADSLYDGEYKLEFNGRDASGNLAGVFPKVIEFQVQTAIPSQYDEISIFPNPFNSSLNITFNLSGKDKPEHFEISFYDLQGRNVFRKDITEQIKLGNNKIEFWNSDNSNKENLRPGMYIYRIQIEGIGSDGLISAPLVGKILFNP